MNISALLMYNANKAIYVYRIQVQREKRVNLQKKKPDIQRRKILMAVCVLPNALLRNHKSFSVRTSVWMDVCTNYQLIYIVSQYIVHAQRISLICFLLWLLVLYINMYCFISRKAGKSNLLVIEYHQNCTYTFACTYICMQPNIMLACMNSQSTQHKSPEHVNLPLNLPP